MNYEELAIAARFISNSTKRKHDVALVLGSGLGGYGSDDPSAIGMPYLDVPGFTVPAVEGHRGMLLSLAGPGPSAHLVFSGRTHAYEGYSMDEVVFGVRAAVATGCRTVILTNAAGGVAEDFEPGDLVLITDHINLSGMHPLIGPNDDRLGPRFPDMTHVYDPELRAAAARAGSEAGVALKEGIYTWFSGPSYETPAEIEMVHRLGGDLVGMSTVPEAIAARHMGARVIGISLVTNKAAGRSDSPLSHKEVTETADRARTDLTRLMDVIRAGLGPTDGAHE